MNLEEIKSRDWVWVLSVRPSNHSFDYLTVSGVFTGKKLALTYFENRFMEIKSELAPALDNFGNTFYKFHSEYFDGQLKKMLVKDM